MLYFLRSCSHSFAFLLSSQYYWIFAKNQQLPFSTTVYVGLQCFDAVGWATGRASGLYKKLSGWVLVWLSVLSKMQTCIWPNGCHCHSLSPASVKSRLVLPFWYRLSREVPEKGPLNGCVRVCITRRHNSQSLSVRRVVDVVALEHRQLSRVRIQLERVVVVALDDPVGQDAILPQRRRLHPQSTPVRQNSAPIALA